MIVHISLPRFYVSKHAPERPLVVIRSRCVLDANQLASRAGVAIGMSLPEAKSILAKNPESLPPVYVEWRAEDYAAEQAAWLDQCVPFSDVIEPVDQHAAFIDLSRHPFPDELLGELLKRLRAKRDIQLGVAKSKWLALAAHDLGDQEQLAYYAPNAFLDELPTSQLLTISTEARTRLEFLGYRTAGAVQAIPLEVLRSQFGEKAHMIHSAARGRGGEPVIPLYPNNSFAERFYFESPVDTLESIDLAFKRISQRLAKRLMPADLQSSSVRLQIGYESGLIETRSRVFSKPMQSTRSIQIAASLLWRDVLLSVEFTEAVSFLRLELLNLSKANSKQNSLYVLRTDSREVLDRSLRQVQKQFGEQALQRASEIPLTRRQRLLRTWKDATGWA